MKTPQEACHLPGSCRDKAHLSIRQSSAPGKALESWEEEPAASSSENVGLRLAHGSELLALG